MKKTINTACLIATVANLTPPAPRRHSETIDATPPENETLDAMLLRLEFLILYRHFDGETDPGRLQN